jgi:hypothetical protein
MLNIFCCCHACLDPACYVEFFFLLPWLPQIASHLYTVAIFLFLDISSSAVLIFLLLVEHLDILTKNMCAYLNVNVKGIDLKTRANTILIIGS